MKLPEFIRNNMYYIIAILIVLIILWTIYTKMVIKTKEGATGSTPAPTTVPPLYTTNQFLVGTGILTPQWMTDISNITQGINTIQSQINTINSYLPQNISDIVVGQVTQSKSKDMSDVGINIVNNPYTTTDASGNNVSYGKWTINAVLPAGLQGPPGPPGPPGLPGNQGNSGNVGPNGERGNWAGTAQ